MKKTILITGSNSGIGKITAEYFANQDWQVIATMRNTEKAGSLKDHPNIAIYELDVTKTSSIEKARDAVINDFGKIDIVVNNAGFGCYGAFEPTTELEIDRQIAVNIKGVMMVTKVFLSHFRKNKSGLFINISSIAGLASYPLASMYIERRKKRQAALPDPIAVAEKIFEAANDASDRLRYLVGDDAEKMWAMRVEKGAETYVEKTHQKYNS